MGDDLVPLLHTVPASAKRLSVSERMVWRLLRIGKLREPGPGQDLDLRGGVAALRPRSRGSCGT